jgi:hypothetical protein
MGAENILLQTLGKISQNAEESTKPTTLEFGEVVSEEYAPLEIQIHDKLILDEAFLELTNAVKDHWVDIEVYWETIDDNDLLEYQTNHYSNIDIQNKNTDIQNANVTIHNANVAAYNSHTHTGNQGKPTSSPNAPMSTVSNQSKEAKHHTSHLHNIAGRKKIRVYNGLHKGEKVVLLRMRGGQKYLVLDRITPHIVGGEWQTHGGAVLDDQVTAPFEVTDKKVLEGWKEDAESESKWANFSKPAKYQAGGEPPK